MSFTLSTVDFSKCGLLVADGKVSENDFRDAGQELFDALSTKGFLYLTNHGFPWSKVDEINDISERFYSLPVEVKHKFDSTSLVLAYDSVGKTSFTYGKLDYNEGFRTGAQAYTDETIRWPDIPGMKESYADCASVAAKLVMRIMKALGYGMKLKDREYMCRAHSLMNQKGNYAILKSLKYPPIDGVESENRLGEHTDTSTITLVFQDGNGGLQVKDDLGNFNDVKPMPGAIILNVGDTLAAWSGNRLKAVHHRVNRPSNPEEQKRIRRSVLYFGQANSDVLMKKLEFERWR